MQRCRSLPSNVNHIPIVSVLQEKVTTCFDDLGATYRKTVRFLFVLDDLRFLYTSCAGSQIIYIHILRDTLKTTDNDRLNTAYSPANPMDQI